MRTLRPVQNKAKLGSLRRRLSRGASLALVIAFAGFLIVCAIAALQLSNMFGASEEARNGVDAGALNVAVRAVEVKVPPQSIYGDCADTSGGIGMTNINRVWGKSLLINANVQSMTNEKQAGETALSNAQQAFAGAQTINNELFTTLTSKETTSGLFNNIAGRRAAKMLTGSANMVAQVQSAWPTAALLRGHSSNLTMSPNQIPADANVKVPLVGNYAPGYTPVSINNKNFYFVSFHPNERPHLVSASVFEASRSDIAPVVGVANAIPNAFSAIGGIEGSQGGVQANAYAIANPQRQYQMAIPHAYLSIQITNTAKWIVQGKQLSESQYGLEPETQWGVKNYVIKNGKQTVTLDGYASLGNEYVYTDKQGQKHPLTLWAVLQAGKADPAIVLAQMTQRLQEINANYSQNQLANVLAGQKIVPGVTRYLIYPTYATMDATNPTITIAPITGTLPQWLTAVYVPDGIEKSLLQTQPERDVPNWDWQVASGPAGQHYAQFTASLNWEPDSGFGQCLGQLRIAHTTECFFAVGM
jgi:hypothetical protein